MQERWEGRETPLTAFAPNEKRAIALKLIATGVWRSSQWTAISQIVHNDSLGLLPDGTLVVRPRPRRRPSELLTLTDAAAVAGVHPATVRRWVNAGKLSFVPGTHPRSVRRSDLEAFLRSHRRDTA